MFPSHISRDLIDETMLISQSVTPGKVHYCSVISPFLHGDCRCENSF